MSEFSLGPIPEIPEQDHPALVALHVASARSWMVLAQAELEAREERIAELEAENARLRNQDIRLKCAWILGAEWLVRLDGDVLTFTYTAQSGEDHLHQAISAHRLHIEALSAECLRKLPDELWTWISDGEAHIHPDRIEDGQILALSIRQGPLPPLDPFVVDALHPARRPA